LYRYLRLQNVSSESLINPSRRKLRKRYENAFAKSSPLIGISPPHALIQILHFRLRRYPVLRLQPPCLDKQQRCRGRSRRRRAGNGARDLVIDRKVEQATQALNARLIAAADTMEKEYKKQQAATGSSPTDEQRTKLKQMAQKIQETIQNNKEVASQARQRFRLEQIQLFRNDVKAVASKLAGKQRATMVLVASQEVLWFTPTADITASVIAEMRSRALSPSENETQKVSTSGETNATSTQNVSGATNATSGETNR
jgi:Skp family chaperone for outer membrane proteins